MTSRVIEVVDTPPAKRQKFGKQVVDVVDTLVDTPPAAPPSKIKKFGSQVVEVVDTLPSERQRFGSQVVDVVDTPPETEVPAPAVNVLDTSPAKSQKFRPLARRWVYDLESGEESRDQDRLSKHLQEMDALKDKATNTLTWEEIMAEKSHEWKLHQDIMRMQGMHAIYFR